MSPRAVKRIFIGYPQGTEGYKVWLSEDGKCTISRNVLFDEENLYNEKKKGETPKEKKIKKSKKVNFSTELIQVPATETTTQRSTEQSVCFGQ